MDGALTFFISVLYSLRSQIAMLDLRLQFATSRMRSQFVTASKSESSRPIRAAQAGWAVVFGFAGT
jgi:hypothetical protein